MSQNCIWDGQEKDGYLESIPGVHEELRFKYRPMLPQFVEDLDALMLDSKTTPQQRIVILSAALSKQIMSWSEVRLNDKGELAPVPIEAESVRRFPYPLLTALHRVIAGMRASDPVPDASPAQVSAYAKELEAMAAGAHPVNEQQKN